MIITSSLKLIRPQQWLKNTFVLAGFFFAHDWKNLDLMADCLLCFAAFCLISSAVYCLNDIFDAESDKANPRKKERPIAAGRVSPVYAVCLAVALIAGAVFLGMGVGKQAAAIIVAYLILNLGYSYRFKSIVLVDVFCIAIGFMLRIMAGTVGVGIPPSKWLLLCTFSLSLFLGFSKRHAEKGEAYADGNEARQVLHQYTLTFLSLLLGISIAASIILYALYTTSAETIGLHQTQNLIYTVPVVTFGLFRYLYLVITQGKGHDTAQEILKDPQLIITCIIYAASVGLILS